MSFNGSGAATGALSGAVAGTALMPGIGTAIGAVGGGLLGGFFGPQDVNPNQDEINRLIGLQHENDKALLAASQGYGPSAAQSMMTHAAAENAANQVGYAKTLGGDNALANRLTAEGIVRGNAEAAHNAAVMRMQEQQQARELYTNQLNSERGAAQGFYGEQAGIQAGNIQRQQQWNGQLMQGAAAVAGGGMGGGGPMPPQQQQPGFYAGYSGGSFY